jgi:hypothetical protein
MPILGTANNLDWQRSRDSHAASRVGFRERVRRGRTIAYKFVTEYGKNRAMAYQMKE